MLPHQPPSPSRSPRVRRPRKAASTRTPYTPQPSLTAAVPALAPEDSYRYWGNALIALGMVLLVFSLQVVLILPVAHARDQQVAFENFRYDLANGTAPVGQITSDDTAVAPGTPVALISVPSLGLTNEVIFAGTSSDVTSHGPGWRRDTVLPGQKGASVIVGRASAYGAPFGHLSQIAVGDTITTVTGQGTATYTVTDIRRDGDPLPTAMTTADGRLTLVSMYSPIPYLGSSAIRVDAKLTSSAFVTPDSVVAKATLDSSEETLAGDLSALPWLLLLLIAVVAIAVLITVAARYWGRWQAWIVGFPVLLLLSSLATSQAMSLLPNTL